MMTALALCALGAERALSNELRKLNLPILESAFGRVRFQADLSDLYRALMALRTADRVLLEAATFPAADFDALFEGTRAVPWEDLIPRDCRVVIAKVRSNRSALSAETSIQAVSHKAVADRLCAAWKVARLPEDGQTAEIRVYLEKDQASILLDLSGEALFRRGYRVEGGLAPLRETTAAAILLLVGWKRKIPLYDPFCGSGTFAAEAALYAWDAAPGLGRSFALSDLAIGDRLLEARVRAELLDRVDFGNLVRIAGSDIDPRAIGIARTNLERVYALARGRFFHQNLHTRGAARKPIDNGDKAAELTYKAPAGLLPTFDVKDVAELRAAYQDGLLVANPPYGERLGDQEQAEGVYQLMASLADRFEGWALMVLTDHPGFESHFGYTADSVRDLTNGALRSYLYQYDRLGRRADVDHRRTR